MKVPCVGIVAGSGLDLLPALDDPIPLPPPFAYPRFFEDASREEEGVGPFVAGTCEGTPVILLRWRRHFYEGLTYEEVVQPIDFLASQGTRALILTNAAGGIARGMKPGHLMAARTLHTWRYHAWPNRPECIEMEVVLEGADSTGSYMWMHGPCYETAAEIEALRRLGMDAVGMSTAPEAQRCLELGLKVAAISCITNTAGQTEPLTHAEVERVARESAARLIALIRDNIGRWG